MKNILGLKEFRNKTEKYINRVNKGESFTVVRRSSPVFKISPIEEDETLWEPVLDFTKIKKGGVSANTILQILRRLNEQDRKIS